MKTKNTRENEVYKKVGRKYVPLGYQWEGFPVDGIWYVQNGRRNMRCLIRADEVVPIMALDYRKHVDGLGRRLMMDCNNKATSWNDIAKECCDYFAELAQGRDTKAPA